MIFGVIYWMFPIVTRVEPRGSERLGWGTYLLPNAGPLLRGGREAMLAGRIAEITAVVFFALHAWTRIVSRFGA